MAHTLHWRQVLEITKDELYDVIAEQLGADRGQVVPEAAFVSDLKADSLDLVDLIMKLEEVTGLVISDDQAKGLVTVQDAENFIREKGQLAA